jgi:hypothetical protein
VLKDTVPYDYFKFIFSSFGHFTELAVMYLGRYWQIKSYGNFGKQFFIGLQVKTANMPVVR